MPASLFSPFAKGDSDKFSANTMLEEIRGFDWSGSPMGEIASWPEAIKHAARMMLLSPTAMTLLIGRAGLVLYNDPASQMFGAVYDGALGRPIGEIFPDVAGLFEVAVNCCLEGQGRHFLDQQICLRRNGISGPGWFDLAFTPIADETGAIFATLLISGDTTKRVLALRDQQHSRERLDLALHHGGIVGTWEIDFGTEVITCDERFARLHGVDPATARGGVDKDAFIAGIHPEDRATVMAAFDVAKATREDYRLQHRVIGTGETRWIIASGRMFEDEMGRLTHFFGVIVDVTELARATTALAESEHLLRALADTIPQIVFSANADGEIDYVNRRWYEYTGAPGGVMGEDIWQSFIHPDDLGRLLDAWNHSVAAGERYDVEFRCQHHSGEYRWMRGMALPFHDGEGRITRWFGTNTDTHEANLLAAERELVAGELDHRIKNLFALVGAMSNLSLRDNPEMAPFADQLQQRLSALHHAHELIRTKGSGSDEASKISLQDLVRKLVKPYAHEDNPITFEGDDADLNPRVVTTMALIFHELATNAAKYGALSSPRGALRVKFRRDGQSMHIDWLESSGIVDSENSNRVGFGSKLLSLSVERQLKGTISRQVTPSGLRVELVIPAI